MDDDTARLFDAVRKSGGIAIPTPSRPVRETTGATPMRKRSPWPKSTRAPVLPTKAWEKGKRIGTIASSNHGSTHLSFAFVYSDNPSRAGLIEAIRKRRTYGSTDNLLLDFRAGDHFMGEDFPHPRFPICAFTSAERGRFPPSASFSAELMSSERLRISRRCRSPSGMPAHLQEAANYYVRVEQR